MEIRRATREDDDGIWAILEPVFRAGESYPISPAISREDALAFWLSAEKETFVVVDDDGTGENGEFLGTYFLRANQPGLGDHVCNCGYVTGSAARGRGLATKMCEHSQETARARGYRAMQFDLVVSTNEQAVRLWSRLGFETVGALKGAFAHPVHGDVDALVMYKRL